MVFKRCIDNVTRARAFYLSRVKGLSVRKVAGFCGISTASVIRISKIVPILKLFFSYFTSYFIPI